MRRCVIIVLLLSLWGCGKSVKVAAPSIDEPDRILYDKALKAMERHNYIVARLELQTLISTYPDSDIFPKAKYALAESFYREGGRENLDSAESAFKDYIIYFRDSDIAADAQMWVAMTHVRRVQSPDRDNSEARLAELELKEMISAYPNSRLLEEAKQKLRDVVEILAEVPKLSPDDRRRLLDRLLVLEDEAISEDTARRTADEAFQTLDAMEAKDAVGQSR